MAHPYDTQPSTESQQQKSGDWTQVAVPGTGVPDQPVVRCRVCNRRLKREPGLSLGVGPKCAHKEEVAAHFHERR